MGPSSSGSFTHALPHPPLRPPRWPIFVGFVSIAVTTSAAIAQVDITGGSPGALPNLSGAALVAEPPAQRLVLQIIVNGTSLGEPSDFEARHGQLFARPQTLADAGIRVDDIQPDADGWIALDSIPGMRTRYVSARQQAVLDVDTDRQIARQIGYRVPSTPKATPGTGFVLNYDASYQRNVGESHSDQLGVWSEQRLFTPFGVLDNTGTWLNGTNVNRYTRLDTNWTYSNAATLFTMTVGDAISGSLVWTRAVRFGGVQIQRDFSLRPDLITFPLPMFTGSAAVPSAVDLYVNGLRQYSGNVAPGPFQIAQAPSVTGAGVAQVVVTDALGRRVTTSVPLYVDTRLLAKGLFDYSAELGFLRDDYTLRSFSYEGSPVGSGTASWGVTDWLTLQAHAEGGQGLSNGGAGAVLGVGNAGVVNVAAAGSHVGGLSGALVNVGYQYIDPRFSVSLQGTRATSGYRDIAAQSGAPVFEHLYQSTFTLAFARTQSATLSYIDSKDTFTGSAHVVTIGYNAQFGRRWSLFASAYRDFAQRDVWGGSLGVTVALGGSASASATVSQSGGHTTADISASRPADFSGGWGWAVQGGAGADYRHAFAGANYRASFGDFQATAQRFNGTTTVTAEAAGALAVMDGAVLPSRTLTDGFALVSTDGVAGVPVLHENRLVGRTNGGGHLLVPDLMSYQRNQLAIDPLALPADASIDHTKLDVAPQRRSGVLADFGVSRYQGAAVVFVDENGQPIPAGSVATIEESGKTAIVGYDGTAFFEQLGSANTIRIRMKRGDCGAQVPYTASHDNAIAQIGPFTCHATETLP